MHHKFTEIKLDRSVLVRFKVITKNSLTLNFKFSDANQDAIDVSGISFEFVVTDNAKTVELIKVTNAQWTRDNTNEILHVINSLDIEAGEYKVDFTCTYPDGRVQTLMDGEFIVRERHIL